MNTTVINMNTLHLNSVRLNGIGKVQSVSLSAGESTEEPIYPPVEPPVEPTPTFTLSASVINGQVSATKNGAAISLPYVANEGDVIVLSVTPNDGYEFNGWADGNTDNPRTITMNADVALSAECSEVVAPPVEKYIQFADPAVEAICVANWSSDGIGLTEEDAAAVTTIGSAFSQNKEITSFDEFRYFTGVTSIRADWDNSTSAYKGAFAGCSNLKKISLPNSLVNLGTYSFYKCTSLSVDITDMLLNLTSIGDYAFYNCPITGKVVMPNITSLGRAVFYQSNVTEVSDIGGVTKLFGSQTGAFYNCNLLESVTLPSTMTSIEGGALYYCENLKRIISRASVPPTIENWSFKGANIEVIYVPDASLEAYKTATNWNTYADRIHPLSEIDGSLVFYDKLVGDGTAFINTEYYPSSWDNVEWDADKPNSYNRQMFGEKSSALSIANLVYSATQTYYCYKLTTSTNLINEDNTGRQRRMLRIVDLGGGTYRREVADLILGTSNTIEASWSGKDATATQSLRVFGNIKSDGAMEKIYNGAIRSLIITDARTNEVKLNLKPCTWNGEAGMWDEVNGKFYGNASTSGEFSVAND